MTVIRPIDAAARAAAAFASGVSAREYTLPDLRGTRATAFAVATPIAVVDASYRHFRSHTFRSFINPH